MPQLGKSCQSRPMFISCRDLARRCNENSSPATGAASAPSRSRSLAVGPPSPARSNSPSRSAAAPAGGGNRPRSALRCGGAAWVPRSSTPSSSQVMLATTACVWSCGSRLRLEMWRNSAATIEGAFTRGRVPAPSLQYGRLDPVEGSRPAPAHSALQGRVV